MGTTRPPLTEGQGDELPVEPSAPLRTTALTSSVWALAQVWGARVLSLLSFVVLSRLLTPDAVGLLALATVLMTFFQIFVDAGAAQMIVRARSVDRELLDTAFWMSTAVGVLLCVSLWVAAGPVARAYGEPELDWVLRAMATTLVLYSLTGVPSALLERSFRFRQMTVRRLVAAVVGALVGIAWAVIAPSVWALVAQAITYAVASSAAVWFMSDYRPGGRVSGRQARELWGFGWSMIGIRLFGAVTDQGDNFIIGLFLGSTQLGIYAVGYRIYQAATELLTGALSQVALPTFSALQDDRPRLRAAFLSATRVSAAVAIPAFALFGALADEVVPLVFGAQWRDSVPVAEVLSIVGALSCVIFFDRSVLIVVGRVRLELVIVIVATIGNIIAFYIGHFWGVTGVAVALAIRAYLFWPIRAYALKVAVDLPLFTYFRQWLGPAVASGCLYGATRVLRGEVATVLAACVGCLIYLIVLRALAPKAIEDVLSIVRTISGKLGGRRRGAVAAAGGAGD